MMEIHEGRMLWKRVVHAKEDLNICLKSVLCSYSIGNRCMETELKCGKIEKFRMSSLVKLILLLGMSKDLRMGSTHIKDQFPWFR